jgi:hypothetical protein
VEAAETCATGMTNFAFCLGRVLLFGKALMPKSVFFLLEVLGSSGF